MDEILKELAKQGPLGIVLAVLFYLYLKERERVSALADKLYDLGMAMTKTTTEVKTALQKVSEDVDGIKEDLRGAE